MQKTPALSYCLFLFLKGWVSSVSLRVLSESSFKIEELRLLKLSFLSFNYPNLADKICMYLHISRPINWCACPNSIRLYV